VTGSRASASPSAATIARGPLLRALACAALLCALLAPLRAHGLPANTWLIVIGENHGLAGDVELLYAERDAREFADAFRQHARVSSRLTTVLLGEQADAVRRTLQEVNASIRMRAMQNPAALIVYYSGHADAESLHLDGTAFSLEELKTIVEGSPAAMRILIVDACRSGTLSRVKGVSAAPSFPIDVQSEVAPEGMAIITSSAANEFSQESDQLRGSFFTHHFINAIRGAADRDGDGKVTLNEAYAYAYDQTLRSSGQTVQLQHPTYAWSVKGRDDLVLSVPGETQGRLGRLKLIGGASYLIMERKDGGPLVAELSPQGGNPSLLLPAGHYFVQRREPAEFREYDVNLYAGNEADLAGLPYRAVRYDQLVRRRGSPVRRTQGLTLLSGIQGQTLPGEGITPQLIVGYGIDFDWGSLGLRLRGSTIEDGGVDDELPRRHTQAGLGLTVQRYVDVGPVSLAFGLLAEGVRHFQTFTGGVPERDSWGAGFGGIISGEANIGEGFAVRVEGGPMTEIFQSAVVANGAQTGSQLATPFTFWLAGGLLWRH
jgi:hypothetical protein